MKFGLGFIGALALAAWIGYGVIGCMEAVDREHAQMVANCAAKGGVILDRTYTHGKGQTGHNYTCVDKSIIK
jgi:hypothetical protein